MCSKLAWMLPIRSSFGTVALAVLLAMLSGLTGCAASTVSNPTAHSSAGAEAAPGSTWCRFEWVGQGHLPNGLRFEQTEVGGLSALVYDPSREVFLALSDDKGDVRSRGRARLYTLKIELDGLTGTEPSPPGSAEVKMRVTGVTVLRDRDGQPFPGGSVDPEGLVLTPTGTLLVSSEWNVGQTLTPFVRELDRNGRTLRSFSIPDAYLPGEGVGVQSNLGFEALTRTPDFTAVFTATENALAQDGPKADLGQGSPSRILRFDPASGRPVAEYLYLTEPVAVPPLPPGGFSAAGLVELLALDADRLLALERSYSVGVGVTARLFAVSLEDATEITGRRSVDPATVRPAAKRLLLDLTDLGVPLDNLEALAWGPDLPDGRRTLLILSDNNFNFPPGQKTQLLVFAVEPCR
jgi:3-phytase